MITAEITVTEKQAAALYQAAVPELFANDRTQITARQEKENVLFSITAQDATAFRATMNALTQILAVFEKMKKIEAVRQ